MQQFFGHNGKFKIGVSDGFSPAKTFWRFFRPDKYISCKMTDTLNIKTAEVCTKRSPNRRLMMNYESQTREYGVKKCPTNRRPLPYGACLQCNGIWKGGFIFKRKNKRCFVFARK